MNSHDYRILLPEYSAMYVDIAKVASSSIKRVLADLLALECPDGNPHEAAFIHPDQNTPMSDENAPLYSFAFVRNPWDRLVSCYRDKIAGEVTDFTRFSDSGVAHCLDGFDAFHAGMGFAEFVQALAEIPDSAADEHFRSQADYVADADNRIVVDFVGRYENLQADFAELARRLTLPVRQLPRLQNAPPRNYTDYYDTSTRALICARYARDIELLNYRFGE